MKLYHDLAEYYFHLEEKHRNIANDVKLVQSLLKNKTNPSLLDLGCGTGEHLNHLSKSGIKCVGIDSSNSMLNIAKSRFPDSIEFQNTDMRYIDFHEEFDIAISLFGSLDYITEDSEINSVLSNIWKALKPNGIGLLEIWNSLPVIKIKQKPLSKISTIKQNDIEIERKRGFKIMDNPDKTLVEVKYNYTVSKNKVIKDRHVMRAFSKNEIGKFILNNGFKIINFYSNSLMDEYRDAANGIIVHFKKP